MDLPPLLNLSVSFRDFWTSSGPLRILKRDKKCIEVRHSQFAGPRSLREGIWEQSTNLPKRSAPSEDDAPLSIFIDNNDAISRLETPTQIVEVFNGGAVKGSGLVWRDSKMYSKETHSLEVVVPPDDECGVMLQLPLSGDFRLTTSDDLLVTGANFGLTYPREKWLHYDLAEGDETHLFTIGAAPKTLADWFGGKLPEALRPFAADQCDASLHREAVIPRPLEEALRLALTYNSPLRSIATEAAALQIMSHCLQRLCGGDARDGGVTASELSAAREAYEQILERIGNPPKTVALAAQFGLPARRLEIAFQELFGASIFETISKLQFDCACRMLREGQPIKIIAWNLGYRHASNFTYAFRRRFGMPPATWLARGTTD